ncbi:hypothetical protein PG984_011375 [Apiospora sp. TS-2023a]
MDTYKELLSMIRNVDFLDAGNRSTQTIYHHIHQMDCDHNEADPEVTHVLARLLTAPGRVLYNIESCAAQDAREAVTGEDEHACFAMFHFDVLEEVDDFFV